MAASVQDRQTCFALVSGHISDAELYGTRTGRVVMLATALLCCGLLIVGAVVTAACKASGVLSLEANAAKGSLAGSECTKIPRHWN